MDTIDQLTQDEMTRYGRHFPIIGISGQKRLKQAKVICIGCGGLGLPALQYMVAAGIGTVALVDADYVEVSNLHRQILFTHTDMGKLKVDCAAQRLAALNPHCKIITHPILLNDMNANDLVADYDVVVDASDNYLTRYVL